MLNRTYKRSVLLAYLTSMFCCLHYYFERGNVGYWGELKAFQIRAAKPNQSWDSSFSLNKMSNIDVSFWFCIEQQKGGVYDRTQKRLKLLNKTVKFPCSKGGVMLICSQRHFKNEFTSLSPLLMTFHRLKIWFIQSNIYFIILNSVVLPPVFIVYL